MIFSKALERHVMKFYAITDFDTSFSFTVVGAQSSKGAEILSTYAPPQLMTRFSFLTFNSH